MGVPTIACGCAVCRSTDPHDRRTRPSVLFSFGGREVIVDTTPDFRYQALRAGLQRLDAVLYTHAHADHILGLDDIRAFNIKQRASVPIYATEATLATLRRTFAYIFESTAAEGSILPGVDFHPITGPFELFGAKVIPVPAMHGPLPVLGFRIGSIAYLTDFSRSRRRIKTAVARTRSLGAGRAALHSALDALDGRSIAGAGWRTLPEASVVHPHLPRSFP